jgi:hypothetical protein
MEILNFSLGKTAENITTTFCENNRGPFKILLIAHKNPMPPSPKNGGAFNSVLRIRTNGRSTRRIDAIFFAENVSFCRRETTQSYRCQKRHIEIKNTYSKVEGK